jgi:hypothetical protein
LKSQHATGGLGRNPDHGEEPPLKLSATESGVSSQIVNAYTTFGTLYRLRHAEHDGIATPRLD